METYFESFPDDHYSVNAFLSVDEDMKDQLDVLESLKEADFQWKEEFKKPQNLVGKEDFQQIMSDWQQHVKLLQSSDSEDLGLGFDTNLDILNTYPERDFYEDKESPILSKALKCPNKKDINIEQSSKFLGDFSNETFSQSLNSSKLSSNSSQKVLGLIKTEPNLIRKVTLLNGEKEILGKNIIGLHCLNEIKENPDENCQVTSTIINGKRYKIIIKPKSLKVKKLSEEKIRKTLIKKLFKCNLLTRTEPKEDEIISEMRNGNYDVPILESDTILPSWDLVNLDSDWKSQMEDGFGAAAEQTEVEPVKKVPPLKIKLPKLKKHKKKKPSSKSDEEVDVETITDKTLSGSNLKNLLENFEDKMTKFQKEESSNLNVIDDKNKKEKAETSKNILTAEVVEKIEALKRKKDHRILLINAMPTKKVIKNCTRMQDAVATMNRNKLLKIVSGGDTVQLDHDYCSSVIVNSFSTKNVKKTSCLEEKNPKKDSGMESGDISDASEGPYTPENSQITQHLNNFISKKVENCSIDGKNENVTNAPKEFFQESKLSTLNSNVSTTDLVKTKTASHGNKALTNNVTKSIDNSDSDNSVPSANINISENSSEDKSKNDELNKNEDSNSLLNNSQSVQKVRPKKKLKLEEYLSRRNNLEKEKLNNFCKDTLISDSCNNDAMSKNNLISSESEKLTESKKIESNLEINKIKENISKDKIESIKLKERKEKKYWRSRSRSSSNSSSERRQKRRQSRSKSKSKSCWRSDSNGSNSRREGRGKHKSRHSESLDRNRRDIWSSSLSRSPSRESSTSSDYCDSKRYKHYSNRYHRRSRSRSVSRLRSESHARSYYNRRPRGIYYCNRNFDNRRSKSPYYSYSMREKQRQIEERRVIYVGRIEEGMTNAKLRERFSVFGPIIDISLHFREYGDNYGFVTYAYKADAYDAVEHGNDDPSLPHYDLCFGGRRGFCKEKYADLDGMPTSYSGFNDTHIIHNSNESFDLLLKEAQAKLKKRKNQ